MDTINLENYKNMKNNLLTLLDDDNITPSSNFLLFLNRFESNNDRWIEQINIQL